LRDAQAQALARFEVAAHHHEFGELVLRSCWSSGR